MPILEFESSAAKGPAPKKPLKLILGAGVLVGALALGSTLAANITLTNDNNVEFGQGVVATTACDPDGITVTPFSTFINATGGGDHKLSSIRISGINSNACDGKTFRIKAYGDGPDSDPLDLFNYTEVLLATNQVIQNVDYNFVDIQKNGADFFWRSGGSDNDDVIYNPNDPTAFTIDFVSVASTITRTPSAASSVKKITVETFDASATEDGYNVFDYGPGGGIIFYVANEPFACGPTLTAFCRYLEVAPYGWYDEGEDPRRTWAAADNQSISLAGAVGTAIGAGYKNSIAIANQTGNIASDSAAVLARTYFGGEKNDWYLPSIDELRQLQAHKAIAGLSGFSFWSSTEINATTANDLGDAIYPNLPNPGPGAKLSATPVRPIRAF
jgi:hypothetical protein